MSEEKKSQMLPEESHKTHGQRVVYQCEHYVVVQRNDYNDVQPDSCYWFRGISNDQQEQCKRASLHDARRFMDQWVKTCGKATKPVVCSKPPELSHLERIEQPPGVVFKETSWRRTDSQHEQQQQEQQERLLGRIRTHGTVLQAQPDELYDDAYEVQ